MKLDKLKSAVRNVTVGGWVSDIPIQGLEGLSLKVRGAHNSDAIRIRTELMEQMPDERRIDMSDSDRDAIALKVMVDAILVDWDLEDDRGDIPCTDEKRIEMLTDPELGDLLRRAVAYASTVVAERGSAALECDAKN